MPDFKQGDNVFIPASIHAEHKGRTAPIYSVIALGDVPVHRILPDLPNLPEIVRYLAAHPETVEALEDISVGYENPRFGLWADGFDPGGFMRDMQESQPNARLGLMLKPATHIWLHGLLKAMRGEVEGDKA